MGLETHHATLKAYEACPPRPCYIRHTGGESVSTHLLQLLEIVAAAKHEHAGFKLQQSPAGGCGLLQLCSFAPDAGHHQRLAIPAQ